jgi:hypothetical protein
VSEPLSSVRPSSTRTRLYRLTSRPIDNAIR